MEWLGKNQIPFVIVFTKMDKLTSSQLNKNLNKYKSEMLKTWEEIPQTFMSSAESGLGKLEILNYIDRINDAVKDSLWNSLKRLVNNQQVHHDNLALDHIQLYDTSIYKAQYKDNWWSVHHHLFQNLIYCNWVNLW